MTTEVRTHTPGPWHIGMKPGPMVYGPQGEQVADLRADLLPKDERLANSRLIVAAPELLSALKGMLEWARRVKELNPGLEVRNAVCAVSNATE